MQKKLSCIVIIFCLFVFIIPSHNEVLANEKRPSYLHVKIFHQLLIAHVLGLVDRSQALGSAIPKETPVLEPTHPPQQPTNDIATFILNGINAYRSSHGLGPVQMNAEVCSFAATRAQEIVANFSHDGFSSRTDGDTLPYSSWSSVTENIAMTSNYQEVVDLWANSPGHAENMRADTPFVCVQHAGDYFAYEGMRP